MRLIQRACDTTQSNKTVDWLSVFWITACTEITCGSYVDADSEWTLTFQIFNILTGINNAKSLVLTFWVTWFRKRNKHVFRNNLRDGGERLLRKLPCCLNSTLFYRVSLIDTTLLDGLVSASLQLCKLVKNS